ncbi:hypothetical protein H2203_006867 [Taxawa tesnikishii (nom. ined.)]|nr:hypothetical protein H2203_006867 [Dothideales sp. JES 119]
MEGISTDAASLYPQIYRTNDYSFRVPTPPRIVVPPPILNANALPDITLSARSSPQFLADIDYKNLVKSNVLLEWSYERRRQAQMILPFLYLGPWNAIKDRQFLEKEGVTMVLGIRYRHSFESKLMTGALRVADGMGIQNATVDLLDNQELIAAFPQLTAQINSHLSRAHQAQQRGKVLVFCESGNERSAGAVAAYLMEMHNNVDYIKAMQFVQSQRFCVNFDDGMKRVLQSYWDIIKAKRDVGAAEAPSAQTRNTSVHGEGNASKKRALERDGDEDETMSDMEDADRFGGRAFAPFIDTPDTSAGGV